MTSSMAPARKRASSAAGSPPSQRSTWRPRSRSNADVMLRRRLADQQHARLPAPPRQPARLQRLGDQQQRRRLHQEHDDQRSVQRHLRERQDQADRRDPPRLRQDHAPDDLQAVAGQRPQAVDAQPFGGDDPRRQKHEQQVRVFAGRDLGLEPGQQLHDPGVRPSRQQQRRDEQQDVLQQDRVLERSFARHEGRGAAGSPSSPPSAVTMPPSNQSRAYVGVNSKK